MMHREANFLNLQVLMRELCAWGQGEEGELDQALLGASAKVHAALLDSINLAGAMEALFELVKAANKYMDEREAGHTATPPGRVSGKA